ncbi:hypothetical protein CYLTODRAFT_388873 [Cylindrobasidium torrendii FP15055 ss-10]|uniref:Microtubule associated protein n=1 Tax=Cylindrobasidium torrendii FP15055 ss-10 TaxID=1314674 RepID=A0A0D7BQ14_9AGAR|nr:hypothetical protein CYLTODRAFT_388873 [Cylindrobasidium torrendii FP15055 ss-10]
MSSLTALLNSLHTHLQTQTHLLPPLHSQLGLPPSALEDELATIQQNLMSSVEAQIESRRREVDEWMAKCERVEEDSIRYQKALGGHIKSTGNSVGEVRKEKVLPRRFEMASEHQEKLRQLYHTKLEQFTVMTNRVQSLVRTLGPAFFAIELFDDDMSTSEIRDVTPERFLRLEKELVRGKGEVAKRVQQLYGIFVQIDWLYTELGMAAPTLDDLPSAMSPPLFARSIAGPSYNSRLDTSDPFLETTPTPASRQRSMIFHSQPDEFEYQRIFAEFTARLEEADDEGLAEPARLLSNVDPTPALIKWASQLQSTLEDTKRRRETHIQTMYDELEGLWRRMGIEDGDMDAFVDAHRGSTDETVREYEEELERMLELKRERMGAFIASAREEIVKLWDELMVGDEERADFAPFADDEHTEELLTIHEEEISRLKEERREKAPLLAAIKKYFEICEEEKELAAAASDQTRLLGRGARDPGRLLREEKMRKRVTKEKPRLEQDLLVTLPAWEKETGRTFLVYGDSMLQALRTTVGAQDQENRTKRSGSVPPRSTTPSNGTGKTGVVTPAVRPSSAQSHSAPSKRMRTEERAPLGSLARSTNVRVPSTRSRSPDKMSMSQSTTGLPRPIAMPIPKPGTQHHALGHGRVPSSGVWGASGVRVPSGSRAVSSGKTAAQKATRAKRESFRPRPSAEGGLGGAGRFQGFAVSVREEEGY